MKYKIYTKGGKYYLRRWSLFDKKWLCYSDLPGERFCGNYRTPQRLNTFSEVLDQIEYDEDLREPMRQLTQNEIFELIDHIRSTK